MKTRLTNSQGFTLVELMVVVAIIGILMAVVYPSYTNHLLKSRRTDAKTALSELTNLQENFFAQNNNYADFNQLSNLAGSFKVEGNSILSKEEYYRITLVVPPELPRRIFNLTATRRDDMAQKDDEDCKTFSINEQGVKTSSPKLDCW